MDLQPATTFCCGCPLLVGVPIILGFHLLACFFYIGAAFSSIVLHVPSFGSAWGLETQMWMSCLYFAGIPIIICALYGVIKRLEANVRLYLFYLTICIAIDTIALIDQFVLHDACTTTSSIIRTLGQDFGEAFVCGITRIVSYLVIVVGGISLEGYCLYVVWSFCVDVHQGTTGPALWELIPGKLEAFRKKHTRHKDENDPDIVGFAHAKHPGPYPSPYGAMQDFGYPSHSILGGTEHDMNYPPHPDVGKYNA